MLLAGVGCPPAENPSIDDSAQDFQTAVYLHNATETALFLSASALRPGVDLDCDTVAVDPGGLLTDAVFSFPQMLVLEPAMNLPLEVLDTLEASSAAPTQEIPLCRAYLLASPGGARWVVWGTEDILVPHQVSAYGLDPADFGWVAATATTEGWTLQSHPELVYARHPRREIVDPACLPQPDRDRLAWSSPPPPGRYRLAAIDRGLDDCWRLHLEGPGIEVDRRWSICAPEQAIVHGPGIELELVHVASGWVRLSDPAGLTVDFVTDAARFDLGFALEAAPAPECADAVDLECGTVTRPAAITLGANQAELRDAPRGVPTIVTLERTSLEVTIVHAQTRGVVSPGCALGAPRAGLDLELTLVGESVMP